MLPENLCNDLEFYTGCMTGALLVSELESILHDTGYENIRIAPKDESRDFIKQFRGQFT